MRSTQNLSDEPFIFALEAANDLDSRQPGVVFKSLGQLAKHAGIGSIHKTTDTIEGLVDSLNALRYDDHNFKDYEVIYLIMPGRRNNICLNGYFYSLQEIAELFEGKLNGKILHFSNAKPLDLEAAEARYFLDVTGAKAISGYGKRAGRASSLLLDNLFFASYYDDDDLESVVRLLAKKQPVLFGGLDFRLYR